MKTTSRALMGLGRKFAAVMLLTGALTAPSHALVQGETLDFSGPGLSAPGSFSSMVSFSLASTLGLNWSSTFGGQASFSSFVAQLFQGATLIATGVTTDPGLPGGLFFNNKFSVGSLAAGTYQMKISGEVAAVPAEFTGQLLAVGPIITAVPEPEVWAMMLVGAGLVGIRLRRKSRVVAIRSPV